MLEFWFDYIKPKYGENVKLCYMGMGSYIFHVKTDYIYKDFAEDVEKIFDTDEDEKAKGTKKCVIKRNLKFSDSKKYLKASQIENRINCLENKKKLIWIVLKKIKKKL